MGKNSNYDQVHDGEGFIVREGKDTLLLACCDCGLIHSISFKYLPDKKIKLIVTRNNKATSVYRRHHKDDLICRKRRGKKGEIQ